MEFYGRFSLIADEAIFWYAMYSMATLRQYFDTDLSKVLNMSTILRISSNDGSEQFEIISKLHIDFDAGANYISYYIPHNTKPMKVALDSIHHPELTLALLNQAEIESGFQNEKLINSSKLVFTKRFLLYMEDELTSEELELLYKTADHEKIILSIRSKKYTESKSSFEKPLAFISHDSRDKDGVAKELAIKLSQMMCPVWYDEFSLKVGQNLRESIEKGLKECEKCILILSPNFLSNTGWTKKEFDSIFTRELLEKKDLILPVWKDISSAEIYNYSPSLANKVGLNWNKGIDFIARELYAEIIK